MLPILGTILGWLSRGPLDRILRTVDHKIDNETERERVKAEVVRSYVDGQAKIASSRQWWFPLLFLFPAGVYFSFIVVYSMLFCSICYYPQPWAIAKLPSPMDEWLGWMIGSLFIGKVGEGIIDRWRK